MIALQSSRLSDRELRALDLKEFLDLIQADIRELDALHRRRLEIPSLPLYDVTCCGKRLGSFPSSALVCCPFCGEWQRPGKTTARRGTPRR